jgi:hypothetical protein
MTTVDLLSTLLQDYKASVAPITTDDGNSATTATPTTGTSQTYGPAYLLDISDAAQKILDSQPDTQGSRVHLSDLQKQKIQDILEKYKDAPDNQDTLNSLSADLQQAGVSPEQIAITQQALDFNPVATFIKILFGDGDNQDQTNALGLSSSSTGNIQDQLQQYLAKSDSLAANSDSQS